MSKKESKRVCVMSGATGAIGQSISRLIAESGKFELILLVRNETKGKALVEKLQKSTKLKEISYKIVDVSLKSSILKLKKEWDTSKPIHGLINCAVVVPRKRKETKEGVELSWATNVLGYYYLIEAFKGILVKNASKDCPTRIVNIASRYAGCLDLKDVELKETKFDGNRAYQRCKQSNRMLSAHYASELSDKNVYVVSCHPGVVSSECLSNLMSGDGWDTADEGAENPSWLMLHPLKSSDWKNAGKFFVDKKAKKCSFCKKSEVEKFMKVLRQY